MSRRYQMTRAQLAHQKKAFLGAFAHHGNVSAACRAAKVPRRTVYSWQEHDEAFAQAYRQAEIEATETLEGEAFRRAFEGITSEKFTPYGIERKVEYSDTLLIFLLKARAPEKYRERTSVEHSGPGGGPIRTDTQHGGGIEVRAVDYRQAAAALRPAGETGAGE